METVLGKLADQTLLAQESGKAQARLLLHPSGSVSVLSSWL